MRKTSELIILHATLRKNRKTQSARRGEREAREEFTRPICRRDAHERRRRAARQLGSA